MTWNSSLVDGPIADVGGKYLLNVSNPSVPEEARAFEVQPSTPNRIFAGDAGPTFPETAFLVFLDEAEARTHLPGLWLEPPLD